MKNNIINLLIILLVISFYFNFQKTDNIIFENKLVCANSREGAKKQLNDRYDRGLFDKDFYDIFYSHSKSSCVYTYNLTLVNNELVGTLGIIDYSTGEGVFSISYDNSSEDIEEGWSSRGKIFEEKIKELKGN